MPSLYVVFYALYRRSTELSEKAKYRDLLVESFHWNFATHMGSLSARARRWPWWVKWWVIMNLRIGSFLE